MNHKNPATTAQIAGHPIHPMLVPFPIVFLVTTLVCDLIFLGTQNPGWAIAAFYLLGAALVTAGLAALAGFADFIGDRRIRALPAAWHHMIGNVLIVLLAVVNWLLRFWDGAEAILPVGLIISFVVVAMLLYTGWRGGDMVYRHGVAVADADERAEL